MNDDDRYTTVENGKLGFMVWDYFDNESVAHCHSKENADRVAAALNGSDGVK